MTGFSRAESKRKQWDGDLQRRDPDSQERTKLGLEMIATRGCVWSEDVCGGLSLWQLGICSTCNEFVQQSSCSDWWLRQALSLLPTRFGIDFKHQALHCRHCCCYYIILSVMTLQMLKIKLNKCIPVSQWPFLFKEWAFFFFFSLSLNHWSSSGGKVEDVTAWNCISYFSSLEVSLEAPDQRIALPPLAFSSSYFWVLIIIH